MLCIYCGSKTDVTNSRLQKRQNHTWRRRQCEACQAVFTTIESADLEQSVVVQYSTRDAQPFSRDRMLLDLYDCLRHRKTALLDATALTNTILGRLLPLITNASLQRSDIITVTTEMLKNFDHPAQVHYQAYHS